MYRIYPKYSDAYTPFHTFSSRKHAYITLTPQTPLLYNKTGVNRGIQYFSLFLLKNIDCGYPLEPPRRGGSNEYQQCVFWAEIWKMTIVILSVNFQFLEVKFSIYLNRRVFVVQNYWTNPFSTQSDQSLRWSHVPSTASRLSKEG